MLAHRKAEFPLKYNLLIKLKNYGTILCSFLKIFSLGEEKSVSQKDARSDHGYRYKMEVRHCSRGRREKGARQTSRFLSRKQQGFPQHSEHFFTYCPVTHLTPNAGAERKAR